MEEQLYVITEEHLKRVLSELSKLPYKDVHVPMYILENVNKLEIKDKAVDDNEKELVEG